MNYYVQEGLISEVKGTGSTSYILNRNDMFFLTEYKVLKSHEKSGFVKCSRLMYNGKQKLLYFTADYKSFLSILPSLDIDGFLTIIANIFKNIMEINNIGFLRCQNIDCSFDKIFVDPNTLSVYMIYLPITVDGISNASFNVENDLRTDLIKLINTHPALNSNKTYKLCQVLANGTKTTADIYSFILRECLGKPVSGGSSTGGSGKGGSVSGGKAFNGGSAFDNGFFDDDVNTGGTNGQKSLRLVAQKISEHLEITVTRSPFILGRSENYADGVIPNNRAIGRKHCMIEQKKGSYFVIDLNSSNGTQLNGKRLNPEQSYPLNNGDILRLANLDFRVSI